MGRQSRVCVFLAIGLAFTPFAVQAQTNALPPEAQIAINEGLADAQQQDFKGAADKFLAARRLAPNKPQIWFDLGLAESKLPGYELRAIAWFKLYLLKVPHAPDGPVVRQQIASLEAAFETKMSTVANRLETILVLRKARYGQSQQSTETTEALRSLAAATGQDLASIRYALGDISGAEGGLVRTNGAGWRDEWKEAWRKNAVAAGAATGGGEFLVASIASAGLLDQAFDMLQQTYDASTVDFFMEQGDAVRAKTLERDQPSMETAANFRLHPDCLQTDLAVGAMSNCRVVGWWGPGRETFLLMIGLNGVELDIGDDETHLADYLAKQKLDATDIQYAFEVYPGSAASGIAKLALDYRRLRGAVGEGRASAGQPQ